MIRRSKKDKELRGILNASEEEINDDEQNDKNEKQGIDEHEKNNKIKTERNMDTKMIMILITSTPFRPRRNKIKVKNKK